MKKLIISAALALPLGASAYAPLQGFAYGRQAAPQGTEWQNPEALSLNKLQPHAWMFNFATVDQAKKVLPENSPYWQSLDGTWKFHWVKTPEERPANFFMPDYDTSGWDDIAVPGCWNVQGLQDDGSHKYGTPIYVNQSVPFKVIRDSVGDWRNGVMRTPPEWYTTYTERNEVGSYTRTFTVPASWDDREVYINFDGVDSFFYLWINGQYVGFSKNSRNTAQFDITPYLVKGENTVAVEVYRYSDASLLEVQDMFRLPGIIRSTYLTSAPKEQIADLVIRTEIPHDANPAGPVTATLKIDATVANLSAKDLKGAALKYEVYPVELYGDKAAATPVLTYTTSGVINVAKNADKEANATLTLADANLWSAETPNRYVLVAQLLDKKGNAIETISTYFGVRQVEIRQTAAEDDEFGLAGRYFYVNNRPVKLKGVNRHENNLSTGHTISREQMEQEAMLMKRGNINHVRNCHYTDDPYWYVVCDKYGIYLEDEANAESHVYRYGTASLSHPVEWRAAHVARNMEMVHAHVNHPSIVIWSLGNEGGPGDNYKAAYEAIKLFDTSRPVQYERNNNIVDMGSNQYPSIPWVREAVKGNMGIKYPFHISEYAHSMGNALGNFIDYWEAMESTNFFCGGAIWDWVDQALWNHTPDGTRYMGYGGDFGDRPNDGMFCMNGIVFPDFTPKPQYAEVKRVHQNVGVKPIDMTQGTVEIFNKNYFTTLSDLQPRWILTRNGVEMARGEDVNRPRMAVQPRSSQTWSIPYDFSKLNDGAEYFVTLQFILNEDKPWAKKGYVQAEVQLPVKSPEDFAPIAPAGAKPGLTAGSNLTMVSGDGWQVAFDNATGSIDRLNYGDLAVITPGNGPRLNALRAPVDNDVWVYGSWFANGLHNLRPTVDKAQSYEREDGAVVVCYNITYQAPNAAAAHGGGESGVYTVKEGRKLGPDDFRFTDNVVYTVYPDGSVEVQSAISSNRPRLILPRLGYEMTLPASLANYTYYGRGPINNYNDRETSQQVGLYRSTVADQFVPFPKPQDMGNREGLRWNALTDATGRGVQFVALDGAFSASALPWTDMEMMTSAHPHELPPSKGTSLHIDKKVLGLGGSSCGQGGPLTHDRVFAEPQTFGFVIRPIVPGADLQAQASVSSSGDLPVAVNRDKVGRVSMFTADRGDTILYYVIPLGLNSSRNAQMKKRALQYTDPIPLNQGGTLVYWTKRAPGLVQRVTFDRIENVPVEVVFCSAQEPGEEASKLVDGDPSTIWHTTYGVTVALYPHWVDFDCGEPKTITGFKYLPRQNGDNGDIKDWRLEVSDNLKDWKEAANGTFERNKNEKRVNINPVKARYVRFTGLNSQNGADFASGAEFTILAE